MLNLVFVQSYDKSLRIKTKIRPFVNTATADHFVFLCVCVCGGGGDLDKEVAVKHSLPTSEVLSSNVVMFLRQETFESPVIYSVESIPAVTHISFFKKIITISNSWDV